MLRSFAHLSYTERVDRLQHMAYAALRAYDLPEAQITPLRIFNNAVFQVDVGHGQRYVSCASTVRATAVSPTPVQSYAISKPYGGIPAWQCRSQSPRDRGSWSPSSLVTG
jgi:hypothetical protein